MKAKTLGKNEKLALETLVRFGSWPSGWTFSNYSTTVRLLTSLTKKGLAESREKPASRTFTGMHNAAYTYWVPTPLGKAVAKGTATLVTFNG